MARPVDLRRKEKGAFAIEIDAVWQVGVCLCIYVWTYICMHACMHACVHACMYVFIYRVNPEVARPVDLQRKTKDSVGM